MTTRPDPDRPSAATVVGSSPLPPSGRPDPVRLAALAARAHELAGSEGIPEAFQALADRLPGATSGSALYGFGARVSLAVGDLAAALDAAADLASRQRPASPDRPVSPDRLASPERSTSPERSASRNPGPADRDRPAGP